MIILDEIEHETVKKHTCAVEANTVGGSYA